MEIGKPTIVDVKEPANEGQIGGQHYKRLADTTLGLYLATISVTAKPQYKVSFQMEDKGGIADLYKVSIL
jgi:hypothetical protein